MGMLNSIYMNTPQELLKNLVYVRWDHDLTLEEGLAKFEPYAKDLESIHFKFEFLDSSCGRKKKYFHIKKEEIHSRLDEWIYKNTLDLMSNKCHQEYAAYLDRYRPLLEAGKIKDIDEYIMNKHYRPQAVRILSKKKSFNKLLWSQDRTRMIYKRRINMWTKDGAELPLVNTFFIRRNNGNKEIIGMGDGSGSLYRQHATFFTAIFYLLGKKNKISQYVLKYNKFNEFEYVGRYFRIIIPPSFGSNFDLDNSLYREIRKKGKELKIWP
jgi:hypothetical protein